MDNSNNYDFTGVVELVGDPVSGVSKTGREWRRQEFVLKNGTSTAAFVIFNDRIDEFRSKLIEGAMVTVRFFVVSNAGNTQYFTTLRAMSVRDASDSECEVASRQDSGGSGYYRDKGYYRTQRRTPSVKPDSSTEQMLRSIRQELDALKSERRVGEKAVMNDLPFE